MPSLSVVVFDLGKVLVDFDYSIAGRRIAARSRLAVNPARFVTDHSAVLLQYELGLITTRQFFDEIRAVTGFEGTFDEFGESFSDIFTEIPAMVALHAALRRRGLPTYAFSNTNELAIRHIRRCFPFFGHFDGYIYSYEHGAMKPDAKLYEVVERETGRRGKEIVYLDDRPENIAAGAARGWQSILHESPEKTRAAVEKTGLLEHA
jgi:FMN phosphatase YigB (HAD superfamily)